MPTTVTAWSRRKAVDLHRTPPQQRRRGGEVARALLALVTLAALVGGVPLLLWRLGGWPLPHSLPSLGELRAALTRPLPDDFIAKTLVTLAWIWWAHFLICVVAEALSALRGRIPVRVPGGWLSQAIAAHLIGAILLLTSPAAFLQRPALAAPAAVPVVKVAHPAISPVTPGQPVMNGDHASTEQPADDIGIPTGPSSSAMSCSPGPRPAA